MLEQASITGCNIVNIMQNSPKQYSVAGYQATKLHEFPQIPKQNFRAYRQAEPTKVYQLVTYVYKFVDAPGLLAHLAKIRQLQHELLGRIVSIEQQADLINLNTKQTQKVIAVVLEEDSNAKYVNLYDFVTSSQRLSFQLVRHLAHVLLGLVGFMQEKGFNGYFNSNDLLFDEKTGQIRVNCYGDRTFYKLKEQPISDMWEVGSLLFTLCKGNPPYIKKAISDPAFLCLKENKFNKFWSTINNKRSPNPQQTLIEFINSCYKQQASLTTLTQSPLFSDYTPLSQANMRNELSAILAANTQRKQQRRLKIQGIKQKLAQSAAKSNHNANNRSSAAEDEEDFLEYLVDQENSSRPIYLNVGFEAAYRNRVRVAQLKALLKMNNDDNVKIQNLTDRNDSIVFKIYADLNDLVSIESQVQIGIRKAGEQISFACEKIQGNFYECLWINNYLGQILTSL